MYPIDLEPVCDGGTIAFKPVRPGERWPRFGLAVAAPLKDRSELPKVVVSVLDSGPLDRTTPIRRARLAIHANRRGTGIWRHDPNGIERFVPAPRPYQPYRRYHTPVDAEVIANSVNAVVAAYAEPLQPEDASVIGTEPSEPTVEHRIGEAVARIVATGVRMVIAGTPDTYVVATSIRYDGGKRVTEEVGVSNPLEDAPVTADRILEAIAGMQPV
jgi:hypothetical protein